MKQDNLFNNKITDHDGDGPNVQPLQDFRAFFKFEDQVKYQENQERHARDQARVHDQAIHKFTTQQKKKRALCTAARTFHSK